jgi:hypothetical protein
MDLHVTDIVLGKGAAIKRFNGTSIVDKDGNITAATGSIGTSEIADSAITTAKIATASITPAKIAETEARTATADGTTTGAITALTGFKKFVTVTSANATDQISLPGITSATIGQEIFLTVASNGYELITPASSNATINLVDSDGTNQLDVAANTTVRCTQYSATAWLAETLTGTAIAVTAPDND